MRRSFCNGTTLTLVVSLSLATPATAGDLEGSAWRLLNIASMDDAFS